jgi:hypothetical protein
VPIYYLSFGTQAEVPGVGIVSDEDIVTYDAGTDTWALFFNGSDVGLDLTNLDAFHVRSDGSILMSVASTFTVPGLTGGPSGEVAEDLDVILFTGTTGPATSGSFSFHFDGSDVGLGASGENIDGLYEFADGSLGISVVGAFSANGATGSDGDVMRFTGSFGAATSGSFAVYFDGSDVGFGDKTSHDLDAVTFDADVDMLFSTVGGFSAAGGSGDDEDVIRFTGTFGAPTSGTAALELDLSGLGIGATEDVNGLSF